MRIRIILLITFVFVFRINAQETIIFENQSSVIRWIDSELKDLNYKMKQAQNNEEEFDMYRI